MREILFRGQYDPQYAVIRGWCYGVPYIDYENDCRMTTHNGMSIVLAETVGQFTGLYDSTKWESLSELEQQEWLESHTKDEWRGRKIFEGDIVRTKYGRLGKVIWFKPQICFDLIPINTLENIKRKAPDQYDLWRSYNLEVVGNEFDNPELMEEQK